MNPEEDVTNSNNIPYAERADSPGISGLFNFGKRPDLSTDAGRAAAAFRIKTDLDRPKPASWITAAFFLVYFLVMLSYEGLDNAFTFQSILYGIFSPETLVDFGAWTPRLVENGQVWRLVSCSWICQGWLSIIFVLFLMIGTGRFLEGVYGWYAAPLTFLAGSAAGNAVMYILNAGSAGPNEAVATPFTGIFAVFGLLFTFALRYGVVFEKSWRRKQLWNGAFWMAFWTILSVAMSASFPWFLYGSFSAGILSGYVFRPRFMLRHRATLALVQSFSLVIIMAGVSVPMLGMLFHRYRKRPVPVIPGFPWEESRTTGAGGARAADFRMKTFTDPDNRYSIDYPAGSILKENGDGHVSIDRNSMRCLIICGRKDADYGRSQMLDKYLKQLWHEYSDRNPRLVEKKEGLKAGGNEFSVVMFLLPPGRGYRELCCFLLITDDEHDFYALSFSYVSGDGFNEAVAWRMIKSFQTGAAP